MPPNLKRCLAVTSAIVSAALLPHPAQTQIAGDDTLGTQVNGSLTVPCTGACLITNGTTRGSNLFHSFRQFSLPNGDFAAFVTNPTIQNVIVRVTGRGNDFVSNINGTIATTDPTVSSIIPTNFFLLNPNGVIFGRNAALFNGGTFLATTAERMQFQDGTEFSTNNPTPLLTISVPIGLQFGSTPGEIRLQSSFLSAGQTSNFTDFALVGGNITLNNSTIAAPGRRVELAGVMAAERVEFTQNVNSLQLVPLSNSLRANVSLTNQSQIRSIADGGSVSLYGQNIDLADGSGVITGIDPGLGSITSQAGGIKVDAIGTVRLSNSSQLGSAILDVGNGGQVIVTGQRVELVNGSAIGSISAGTGNAGGITVTARESISLSGRNIDGTPSGILSAIGSVQGFSGVGDSGNILLQAPSISLDEGFIGTSNLFAQGNVGNIQVEASTELGMTNGAVISAATFGTGNAGNIQLTLGKLQLTNGAAISAETFGAGKAGDMRIKANTITLDGTTPNGQSPSRIVSSVDYMGIGNGGDITVEANSLTLTNGATVNASTSGYGNAGNVQVQTDSIVLDGTRPDGLVGSGISSEVSSTGNGNGGGVLVDTNSLTVTNGATISASTFGRGNAGGVRVQANTIALDGTMPNGLFSSGFFSSVGNTGQGNGGDVSVDTNSLTVTNGATISASTFGRGNAGGVRVQANTIALDGTTPNGLFSSGISSSVSNTGNGNGSNILVDTNSLSITNGATISAGTIGNGNAGSVQVRANTIALDGTTPNGLSASGISSEVSSTGNGSGGDVSVDTNSLTVTTGATISASTFGTGNAGSVRVRANTIALDGTIPNGLLSSGIFSSVGETGHGNGGDISVDTNSLTVTTGAVLSAGTSGNGNAGSVRVRANTIALDGTIPNGLLSSGISSEVSSTGNGSGGDISVDTNSLTVTTGAVLSAGTSGNGNAGSVRVRANTIALDGTTPNGLSASGISSSVGNTGNGSGGNVTVITGSLSITNRAVVSSSTFGQGKAGNLTITADDRITLNNSGISTASISLSQAGNIVITAPQLFMDNQGAIGAVSTAADGGNITLNIHDLLLMRRGSLISATAGLAEGGGNGGNITIHAPKGFIIGLKSENSDITANAFTGSGGRVNITAQGIYGLEFRSQLTPFSDITASSQFGRSGIVTLNIPDIDPSRGLQQLPVGLVDPSQQIDQSCTPGSTIGGGSFTVTGRGGLPESPFEPLRNREAITNWIETEAIRAGKPIENQASQSSPIAPPLEAIVEADRWLVDKDGKVILVASQPLAEQRGVWQHASPCPAVK